MSDIMSANQQHNYLTKYIWSSHSGDAEDSRVVECYAASAGN